VQLDQSCIYLNTTDGADAVYWLLQLDTVKLSRSCWMKTGSSFQAEQLVPVADASSDAKNTDVIDKDLTR
jgi:hypothetical protein